MFYDETFIRNLILLIINYMCFTNFLIIFLYYIQNMLYFCVDIFKNIKRNEIYSI
jgi:hypothetical protein